MSDRWNEDTKLSDIQKNIIAMVYDDSAISDYLGERIWMTSQEYRIACDKLIEIFGIPLINEYCISIIAVWVASFTMKRETVFYEHMLNFFQRLPQYGLKDFFNQFIDTFHDFGIMVFDHDCKTVEDIHELLKMHAKRGSFVIAGKKITNNEPEEISDEGL